jgi:hypothetical protein
MAVVAGSTDPSHSAVSIHEIGKPVEGALFLISRNSGPFLRCFGSLDA